MTAISLQNVRASVSGEQVLSNIWLDIDTGEFCVVIGPSGCGKSTLLKSIAGLLESNSGKITLRETDAKALSPAERSVGFVFQEFEETLFPHKTVAENVGFGLKQQDEDYTREVINKKIDDILEFLAISETRDSVPDELSGGQQQRVELARQLVRDCDIMLLDDPLADLDYKLQKRLELDLHRLQRDQGSTFVYVTHNQDQALKLADKLVIMNYGQIEQVGTPEEVYREPKTAFVARFVGDSNLFVSEVKSLSDDGIMVGTEIGDLRAKSSNGELSPSGRGVTILRPEHVQFGENARRCENTFTATLDDQTYSGKYTEYRVMLDTADSEVTVVKPGRPMFDVVGEQVDIGWETSDAQYFERLSINNKITIGDLKVI